jgi:hypothetical protein
MSTVRATRRIRRRFELAAAGAFVLANLLVPLVVADFFPFTTTPMFRDKPRYYSEYEIYKVRGGVVYKLEADELSRALLALGLNRTYDGNPPGLGVGQLPPPTLDRFSETLAEQPGEEEVRRHVEARLAYLTDVDAVDVIQNMFGPQEDGGVGVVQSQKWRIERPRERP